MTFCSAKVRPQWIFLLIKNLYQFFLFIFLKNNELISVLIYKLQYYNKLYHYKQNGFYINIDQ